MGRAIGWSIADGLWRTYNIYSGMDRGVHGGYAMATWGYVAIDKSGKETKGSRDADSKEQVTRELKNQGMIVLDITEQNALTKDISIDFGGKPTPRDLAVFCRQFASITRAGVTIIQTLKIGRSHV